MQKTRARGASRRRKASASSGATAKIPLVLANWLYVSLQGREFLVNAAHVMNAIQSGTKIEIRCQDGAVLRLEGRP